MFGPHLTLDCYGCDEEKLNDLDFILKFLDELVVLIGMHKISGPHAIKYEGNPNSFDKGGISAIVLIAESHISIHTFPFNNYMSIDIFSCKDFDIDKAIEFTIKKFGVKKYEKNFFSRGKEFPKEVNLAMSIVRKKRKKLARKF
ncbi:MAG: adenosylmethionine decarboxylase [Candidatus Pacearchaeota archaeon]|nr:adenosylmethionine decarboxylase [Candidatus Pacearchaeota archaeon]